ncbi:hypothetical protein BUALT_Bualt02G0146500 [Buddleja alternifolia]|uniref:Uncharacterized protein n=1 Tax=Buddleja alternifolia TaxID=168488 RepID=A0AAV6Y099_9LAMI|nr:hypothetical protein BUALT_Bualt02G0146500 [Buddleja alternifolia]
MVTNFLMLSSFSLAKTSLRKPPPPPLPPTTTGNPHERSSSFDQPPGLAGSLHGSLRSLEPRRSSKPMSYLLQPMDEGNTNSSNIVRSDVDRKASAYIRKVHEKNRHNSNETSNLDTYIMPPPPHLRMQ